MMKTLQIFVIALFTAMISMSVFSCKEDEAPKKTVDTNPKDTTTKVDTIRYTNNVKMLLDSSCNVAYCHISGASVGSLASYVDAKNFVANGRILGAVKHEAGFSKMPKNQPKLSDAKIKRIELWISQGANE